MNSRSCLKTLPKLRQDESRLAEFIVRTLRKWHLAMGPSFAAFAMLIGWLIEPGVQAEEARVIVISPHNEAIRYEFARRFAQWHVERHHEPATVEWRDIGGSTDAFRFIQSEFARKPEGIGIDCFFGGGLEPYLRLADLRLAQPYQPPAEILNGIPQSFNGVEVYDQHYAWFGAALSSFGILQSLRVQGILGLPRVKRWEQLALPEVRGWVGAGDPRNSGTMSTMFETFLQAYGWDRGWNILVRMGGNVRKFDRFSSNTAKDVTLGETAYALAIDFYGFIQVATAGRTNLTLTLPEDFSAIVPDGLAILRGAPHQTLAQHFVDFVLSEEGQKLWLLPRGYPGGPQQYSIERMAVRPDLYPRYRGISNIEYSPFDLKQTFRYDGQLARARAEVVAALVGALLVDTHPELQRAWQAVIRRGLRPTDLAALGTVPIDANAALELARGRWHNDPAYRNHKKIEWQRWAQNKYRNICETKP
jgi:iron(III) transport system substrate-binding protein